MYIKTAERTIPAGGATYLVVGAPRLGYRDRPTWSVSGLPPGATAQFLRISDSSYRDLAVLTSCLMRPGTYNLTILASTPGITQSIPARLEVKAPLPDSELGTFTRSFKDHTVTVRRGGPSTERIGPFQVLHLCDTAIPRKLKITIQAATSEAGTPLTASPRFTLLRLLEETAPQYIAVDVGTYTPNALEVVPSDGGYSVSGGPYMLVFDEYPARSSDPPEKRPATVTYRLEFVQ